MAPATVLGMAPRHHELQSPATSQRAVRQQPRRELAKIQFVSLVSPTAPTGGAALLTPVPSREMHASVANDSPQYASERNSTPERGPTLGPSTDLSCRAALLLMRWGRRSRQLLVQEHALALGHEQKLRMAWRQLCAWRSVAFRAGTRA